MTVEKTATRLDLSISPAASMKCLTVIMASLIVIFNVQGYGILFPEEKWFGWISPFAVLLGTAELAVLVWTSNVISFWPSTSRILKGALVLVVLAFGLLSFTGINSYLSHLATKDIADVQVDDERIHNNELQITQNREALHGIKQELEQLRQQRSEIIASIDNKNGQIKEANTAASDRRRTALDCAQVPDCRAAVASYEDAANRINQDLQSLYTQRVRLDERIHNKEQEADAIVKHINQDFSANKLNQDKNADTKVGFKQKQDIYANLVLSIASWFNWQPKDPFGIFISFVSLLIYPIYFLLNLYSALNSDENCKVRQQRRNAREVRQVQSNEHKRERHRLLRRFVHLLRARVLRKKREFDQRRSYRAHLMTRLRRYFQVWAHRRTKTRIQEVERIVEVPTTVEKEIEKIVEVPVVVEKLVDKIVEVEVVVEKPVVVIKEVQVEQRVEVPVEVDRIVKVDHEVPVYIDRVKEIPVPYFVNDPQIVVHERIIPVPEGITGEELEELLRSQPVLNQEARAQQHTVRAGGETDQSGEQHEVIDIKDALHAQHRS